MKKEKILKRYLELKRRIRNYSHLWSDFFFNSEVERLHKLKGML